MMRFGALVVSMVCLPVLAAPTGFAERGRYASGAAMIESAAGGDYVQGVQLLDSRVRTAPMLLQAPLRQTYVFFSVDEEQALLGYREEQLAAQRQARVMTSPKRRGRTTARIEWPKVVLREDDICVPELGSDTAADWRDHLVCHRDGGR